MNNIKWVGDNCADGVFIPIANASYEVKPIQEDEE